jgi:hypothetical protein
MMPLSLRQTTHIRHAYRQLIRRNRNTVRRSFALSFYETPHPAPVGFEKRAATLFKPESSLRCSRCGETSFARQRAPPGPNARPIRERTKFADRPLMQKVTLSRRAPAQGRGTEQDEMTASIKACHCRPAWFRLVDAFT